MQSAKDIIEACQSDLVYTTSRSSGSGGQHVNKVETRVTLRWSIANSPNLSSLVRAILLDKLSSYINKEGELVLHSATKRSQLQNKQTVTARWSKLVSQAMTPTKVRKPTKPTSASVEKRASDKKKRSEVKALRRKNWDF